MAKIVHIVWSPNGGPIAAYTDPTKAHTHARTMLGVDVGSCELRDQLPDVVRDDIQVEWEGDEDTPRVVDVEMFEVDDHDQE